MADADVADAERTASSSALGLRRWMRGLVIFGALCALVAGSVAVFLTENGVGSAALLVVGLFLGIVGVTDRVPSISAGGVAIDAAHLIRGGQRTGFEQAEALVERGVAEGRSPQEIAGDVAALADALDEPREPSFAELHKPSYFRYRKLPNGNYLQVAFTMFDDEVEGYGGEMPEGWEPDDPSRIIE